MIKELKNFQPQDVDLSNTLQSTFGEISFEEAAVKIVKFLIDPNISSDISLCLMYEKPVKKGWRKLFSITDFEPEIGPSLFAMLCASGWIINCWFPKHAFLVSDAFIIRLYDKTKGETQ